MTLPWTSLAAFAMAGALVAGEEPRLPLAVAPGPFQASHASLRQYRCPEWYRDAKFGIWAHWGPQSVPMQGDWYARGMYEQGSPQYQHHLAQYGHPSKAGYKDLIPLWKAEKWDPDRLMALYKRAGARYFVSMASHHDNFHLWNSRHQPWNAVNMGPHKDVVGLWQQAARKQGLPFGVSEHLGASFTWFQASHGADKTGPLAGVPYDGADPRFQDLYHPAALDGDDIWYSNDPRWFRRWYDCLTDLVDNYHPDFIYTDGSVPFDNYVGYAFIAHYYNSDPRRRGADCQVVYTCKQPSGAWVEDVERGVKGGIGADPWQTDTSIGDWFYNRNWTYRPVGWVVHMLADVVSKNGNLLLNVVQRPDGSLDPQAEQLLGDLAAWMDVNGEAIYGTRPWASYGEGPARAKGGMFKEDFGYTAKDIRFTTRGPALYAIALGRPADGRLLIKSLASAAGAVQQVTLLGSPEPPAWKQTAEGLEVRLPQGLGAAITTTLKIQGTALRPAAP